MVQENTDVTVDITTDDVQAVMQANPMMALQVQNRALMRKLSEARREISELTASMGERGDILPKREG